MEVRVKKDRFHCPIYHMPRDFICPVCKGWNPIGKPIREHFEKFGAVGVECGQCGATKYWYKVPDPREKLEKRMKQVYWTGED